MRESGWVTGALLQLVQGGTGVGVDDTSALAHALAGADQASDRIGLPFVRENERLDAPDMSVLLAFPSSFSLRQLMVDLRLLLPVGCQAGMPWLCLGCSLTLKSRLCSGPL